ncbi:MAG: ATP-binding protein [Acidobacteriota bacterium]
MSPAARDSFAVGGVYVILAGLWIYLSDAFLGGLAPSVQSLAFWQTVKGLGFITATGLLLVLVTYRQLRKRESVQEALRVTENYLTAMLESARGFGLFRLEVAPREEDTPKVLLASPAVSELLAISDPYDFSRWSSNVLGEEQDAFQDQLVRAVRDGQSHQQIFRVRTPADERVRWIEGFGMPANDSRQGAIYLNGLLVDITDRVLLEQQLAQAQRLEAVGQLAGGIAHDFNNLLTVILGQTQLLAAGLAEDHPLSRGLSEVESAAERAADLTRQLLTFSRRQMVEPRVLQLNERVTDLERIIQRLIGEDIEFSVSLAADLRLVRIDPSQLDQVIMNLCVNARDAMPGGGRLVIETMNTELDEAFARSRPGVTPGHYVLLSVRDTGVGMDKAVQARVFEPFFTTKGRDRGTGLGLSTVYGIVKKAGGNVWVESAPGKGAEFQVYLPQVEGTGKWKDTEHSSASPAGDEQVLVVEDDPAVRQVICELLRELGYVVNSASTPDQVLAMSDEELARVELLLTDVILPTMTGKELAQRLRRRRPELRILFASGYTDSVIAQHGILDDHAVFLQKPFTKDRLARKVREALHV